MISTVIKKLPYIFENPQLNMNHYTIILSFKFPASPTVVVKKVYISYLMYYAHYKMV